MSAFDSPEFRRQKREWYALLAQDGFSDLELGQEDGPLYDPALRFEQWRSPGAESRLAECAEETRGLVDGVRASMELARDVLMDDAVWADLPVAARRWWGLQVLCDWKPTPALRFVGAHKRAAARWARHIKAAMAARRSA